LIFLVRMTGNPGCRILARVAGAMGGSSNLLYSATPKI
jgi:hypothetical protein